jgi:hypothetical protein
MLYAILCYDSEAVVGSWTKEQDAAAIAKLDVVQDKLARDGRLGPVARLMPTTTATTLRKGSFSASSWSNVRLLSRRSRRRRTSAVRAARTARTKFAR